MKMLTWLRPWPATLRAQLFWPLQTWRPMKLLPSGPESKPCGEAAHGLPMLPGPQAASSWAGCLVLTMHRVGLLGMDPKGLSCMTAFKRLWESLLSQHEMSECVFLIKEFIIHRLHDKPAQAEF